MRKFNFYAGVKKHQYNLESLIGLEFETIEEAREVSIDFAKDLYYLDPERDVMEIMEQDKVTEEEAHRIFLQEMYESVIFHFEEIVKVNDQVSEIVKHQ